MERERKTNGGKIMGGWRETRGGEKERESGDGERAGSPCSEMVIGFTQDGGISNCFGSSTSSFNTDGKKTLL